MQHNTLQPQQALDSSYLRLKTARHETDRFEVALTTLLNSLNPHDSAEQARNCLRKFLLASFYRGFGISTKVPTGLILHTGRTSDSPAGVLLEVNLTDLHTTQNLNYEVVHKLLLSYLQERVQCNNCNLHHLIATNVHEWIIVDALEFDRVFLRNRQLLKNFANWSKGRIGGGSKDFFYRKIAAPAVAGLTEGITYTYFDLRDYESSLCSSDMKYSEKLVQLYKLLSPLHLLKGNYGCDSQLENNSPVCYAHAKEIREGF